MKRISLLILSLALFLGSSVTRADESTQGPAPDTRLLWVYEGGWFEALPGNEWLEVNREIFNEGSEFTFTEVSRDELQVTLYDKSRDLTVCLTENRMKWRQGSTGAFHEHYQGRWKIAPAGR